MTDDEGIFLFAKSKAKAIEVVVVKEEVVKKSIRRRPSVFKHPIQVISWEEIEREKLMLAIPSPAHLHISNTLRKRAARCKKRTRKERRERKK